MDLIKPWIIAVHAFHWWPTYETRFLLEEGADNWKQFSDNLRLSKLETHFQAIARFFLRI
jgi:hypothetical protein